MYEVITVVTSWRRSRIDSAVRSGGKFINWHAVLIVDDGLTSRSVDDREQAEAKG